MVYQTLEALDRGHGDIARPCGCCWLLKHAPNGVQCIRPKQDLVPCDALVLN